MEKQQQQSRSPFQLEGYTENHTDSWRLPSQSTGRWGGGQHMVTNWDQKCFKAALGEKREIEEEGRPSDLPES